ncbi:uncharacterized protein Z519_00922 [Cladophialophora bantiana CBS 173.52]|uniref:Uncharacterized protein n=1 Tax=Cladophialophora bantiana (strain ATCC 10958 / CBS 173.52 / CDC B-1940 / NIH 8579) TaxID=1442370 RepID=A0A0D2IR86_CLAB1|nr:uncharacterized protein Z519_00922 [Cladophialophora bantiana CBS 173.52]KIW99259.1 hypothetical protein Z519_00922 [Cladophialophora bantiana CBS 173.52]
MAFVEGKVVSKNHPGSAPRAIRKLTASIIQVALTSGASGIGLEIAKLLAEWGGAWAILSIAAVNQQGLDDALKVFKEDKHIATVVDVRDGTQVKNWIEKTVQQFGRLDSGINLAGVARMQAPIIEGTDDDWDFRMGVNGKGVFHCMREQLKHMKSGGSIVSLSTAPFLPRKKKICFDQYVISKVLAGSKLLSGQCCKHPGYGRLREHIDLRRQ